MQGPEDEGWYDGVQAEISNSPATLRVSQSGQIAAIALE
jgi:hypothetical protein